MAVYGGLVNHPFQQFDDPIYVTNNYYVQQGLTKEGFLWAFQSLDVANWHPLTWLSHMLDVEVFGPKPAGHYLTNIILHSTASLLLFWLIRRCIASDAMAFAIALIWAVHPANVECVAWIAQRKSLLSACFIFAGLILYSFYQKSGRRSHYLLCIVAQLLASMAKPIAVLFPVALILMDAMADGFEPSAPCSSGMESLIRTMKALITSMANKVIFIAIAGYLSVLTFYAQNDIGATGFTYKSSLLGRAGNALESLFDYSIKSITMPESSVLYVLKPLDTAKVLSGALLLCLFITVIVVSFRKMRPLAIGILWYLLMFLPTIGLVQVGSQRLADRYLELPLVGMLAALAYCVFIIFRNRRLQLLMVLVLSAWTLGLGFQARALCVNWSDDYLLSQNAIAVGGRSWAMLTNCSVSAIQRRDYARARAYLAEASDETKTMQNLMVVDLYEKKYDDAILKAKSLFSNKGARVQAAMIAARAFTLSGRPADATRAYKGAIRFLPKERSYLLNIEQFKLALPSLLAASEAQEKEQKDGSKTSAGVLEAK